MLTWFENLGGELCCPFAPLPTLLPPAKFGVVCHGWQLKPAAADMGWRGWGMQAVASFTSGVPEPHQHGGPAAAL